MRLSMTPQAVRRSLCTLSSGELADLAHDVADLVPGGYWADILTALREVIQRVDPEARAIKYECMNCGELVGPAWANKCRDELGARCRP